MQNPALFLKMEQRKLIKLGNSSFAIALPKSWIDKAGLKKGDKIFLEENGNGEITVTPSPESASEGKTSLINCENKDISSLKREITAYYVSGYSSLIIKGKRTKELNDSIKRIISSLLGMEIVKEESEEIEVKDLLNLPDVNLNNFIRRMKNNLQEMLDTLELGISKGTISPSELAEINEADEDINKFHVLISRILSKGVDNPSILTKLKIESNNLVSQWRSSFNLERIGDEIKSAARVLKNEKLNAKEAEILSTLIKDLKEVYKKLSELEQKERFDKEKTMSLIESGKKIWEEFDNLAFSKNPSVARIAMKLKEVETALYQNIKIILNRIN